MVIAEIGLNHKGSEAKAARMLRSLVKTGIDAISFQIPSALFYEKAGLYGKPLSKQFYKKAIKFVHAHNKSIGFAIADIDMISFLDKEGADFWKTLSTDIFNYRLQSALQKTNKVSFISTGLSDESEILEVDKRLKKAIFIHTQLSERVEDVNLRAIARLKNITKKKVAFGLHCSNINVLYLSIAFEPSAIFFYVKDDVMEKYPDDEYAVTIDKVNKLAKNLKELKKTLGSGIKKKIRNKLK